MQIQAPSGSQVQFGPQTAQVVVQSVTFDLVNHTFQINYGPPGGATPPNLKTVRGNIPAALQTALESHAQAAIEANEGWTVGSSTVTQP